MEITRERWNEAQKAERICHKFNREDGFKHYFISYMNYFEFLGIGLDQSDKVITEIGCADFPALEHCKVKKGYLVEPMPSDILKELLNERPELVLIPYPVEDIELPESDEIWLLNVMQHVINPDLFIEKCKKAAKVIRFFEPIDWPIEIYHPHTFTFEYYKKHFPMAQLYGGERREFHQAKCAYGLWSQV